MDTAVKVSLATGIVLLLVGIVSGGDATFGSSLLWQPLFVYAGVFYLTVCGLLLSPWAERLSFTQVIVVALAGWIGSFILSAGVLSVVAQSTVAGSASEWPHIITTQGYIGLVLVSLPVFTLFGNGRRLSLKQHQRLDYVGVLALCGGVFLAYWLSRTAGASPLIFIVYAVVVILALIVAVPAYVMGTKIGTGTP